jgi:hypothetical protein
MGGRRAPAGVVNLVSGDGPEDLLRQFAIDVIREVGVRRRDFRAARLGAFGWNETERRWRDEGPVPPARLDTVRKYLGAAP